jgi:hypothetical protein
MVFTSPLFLTGLVAVAIPIVVHLFNFRRYKKVYFSNVEHLEQLQTETRRQSTLRQLLILATRIMAIVFLVLAFARPVTPNHNSPLRTGASDVSIYVDNSFSMENSDGSTTLLEAAKNKSREIVAAYGPTDRFQLITNDLEGRHFHWLSKEEMLSAIDEVQVSSASPKLSTVSRRQNDFLKSGRNNNKQAFVISDFQSSVVDLDIFPRDSSITTTLVPLESTSQNNVYIDSLALNAPAFYRGNSVTATVWLRNDGDENLEKTPVTLYINDRQRAIANVDIPAQATATTDMHFTIDGNGILDGRVETTDYPVTFDDKYYFSLNIRERIKMLTVEGNSTNEYLNRLFGSDSSIAYKTLNIKQMDFSYIEGNDIILLDELPSLTTGMVQTLHSFVNDGGTLVVIPAANADETSYNEALRLFAAPQLSGYNKGRSTTARVDFDNQLYRNVFASKSNDNIELPTVSGYHRLAAYSATLRDPIITLANGDDYLCATPCGNGRIYLFAAPLRDAHTDFVRQALFVPTLYNMALYSIRPTPPATTLGSTMPIVLSAKYDNEAGSVKLVSVERQKHEGIPDIRRTGNTSTLVQHGTLADAGNYHIVQDGKDVEGLSFNYSRLESQMDFTSRGDLVKMLKDYNLDNCSVVRNVDKPLDSYLKEQMQGHRLWRWCILLALLMLAFEVLLVRLPK